MGSHARHDKARRARVPEVRGHVSGTGVAGLASAPDDGARLVLVLHEDAERGLSEVPVERLREAAEIAVVVGGPGLYLLAHALFRRRMTGKWGPKRLYGAAGCLAVGAAGPFVPALVLAGLVIAVLAAVISSEHFAAARRARRGEPTPLERLEARAEEKNPTP